MSRCGIVIPAAGASVRMGVAKQSLVFEGKTLLQRAVETAMGSKCRPVVVVLGSQADELRKLLPGDGVDVVINLNWAGGIGTSIRAGISQVQWRAIDAAMIFQCDQPLVKSALLDRMVDQHFTSGAPITAAFYAGTAGTPVIFDRFFFDELLALQDSQGGKVIVNRHVDRMRPFALPEAEADVDTVEDFEKLVELARAGAL